MGVLRIITSKFVIDGRFVFTWKDGPWIWVCSAWGFAHYLTSGIEVIPC